MNPVSLFATLAGFSVMLGGCSAEPASNAGSLREQIGIYDSRAIAIAFVGGDVFRETMNAAKAEFLKAKESGEGATLIRIDMTESLVDLITTDPKQRKAAMEILDQDPVPPESLEDHDD